MGLFSEGFFVGEGGAYSAWWNSVTTIWNIKHVLQSLNRHHKFLWAYCNDSNRLKVYLSLKASFLLPVYSMRDWNTEYCFTVSLQVIIEQGGLAPGGLNFDCKIRRESTDLEDMFIAHIGKLTVYTIHALKIDTKTARVTGARNITTYQIFENVSTRNNVST